MSKTQLYFFLLILLFLPICTLYTLNEQILIQIQLEKLQTIKQQNRYSFLFYHNENRFQNSLLFLFTLKNIKSTLYIFYSENEINNKELLLNISKTETTKKINIAEYGTKFSLKKINMKYNEITSKQYRIKSQKGFYYIIYVNEEINIKNNLFDIFITRSNDNENQNQLIYYFSDTWVTRDTQCNLYEGEKHKKIKYIFDDSLFENTEILVQYRENGNNGKSIYLTKDSELKEINFVSENDKPKEICITYCSKNDNHILNSNDNNIVDKTNLKIISLIYSAKLNIPFKVESKKETFYRLDFNPEILNRSYYKNNKDLIKINGKQHDIIKVYDIIGFKYIPENGNEINILNIDINLKENSSDIFSPKKMFTITQSKIPHDILNFFKTKKLINEFNEKFIENYKLNQKKLKPIIEIPNFKQSYIFIIEKKDFQGSYILNFDKELNEKEFNFMIKINKGLHNELLYLYFDSKFIYKFTNENQKIYIKHYKGDLRQLEFHYIGGVNPMVEIILIKENLEKRIYITKEHLINIHELTEPTYFITPSGMDKYVNISFYKKTEKCSRFFTVPETVNIEYNLCDIKDINEFPFILSHESDNSRAPKKSLSLFNGDIFYLNPLEINIFYTIEIISKKFICPDKKIIIDENEYGAFKLGLKNKENIDILYQINYCKNKNENNLIHYYLKYNKNLNFGFYKEDINSLSLHGNKHGYFLGSSCNNIPDSEEMKIVDVKNNSYGIIDFYKNTAFFEKYNEHKVIFTYSLIGKFVKIFENEVSYVNYSLNKNILRLNFKIYFTLETNNKKEYHYYSERIKYKLILVERNNNVDYNDYCQLKELINEKKNNIKFSIDLKSPKYNITSTMNLEIELDKNTNSMNMIGLVYVKIIGTEIDYFYPPLYFSDLKTQNIFNYFWSLKNLPIYFIFLLAVFIVIFLWNENFKRKIKKNGLIQNSEGEGKEMNDIE